MGKYVSHQPFPGINQDIEIASTSERVSLFVGKASVSYAMLEFVSACVGHMLVDADVNAGKVHYCAGN